MVALSKNLKALHRNVLGIIPARYGSSRFPGKVLVDILGKSLLQRTYEQAKGATLLSKLIIATDDERVMEHAHAFGAEVVMTSVHCPTGTDRVAEAAALYELKGEPKAQLIVNIQADEPLLEGAIIDRLILDHLAHPEALLMTPVTPLDPALASTASVVKCVFDIHRRALYFSRALLPYPRSTNPSPIYRHLGIYSFQRPFLADFVKLPLTPLSRAEDLEQLKVLEHGLEIFVTEVEGDCGIEVNYPEDIARVVEYLCKKNISSSQAALSLP